MKSSASSTNDSRRTDLARGLLSLPETNHGGTENAENQFFSVRFVSPWFVIERGGAG